jgi:hypothetical protein
MGTLRKYLFRWQTALIATLFIGTSHFGCNSSEQQSRPLQGERAGNRRPTELNSSVITIGTGGLKGDFCTDIVERAAQLKQSRIMFVPTLFWVAASDESVDYYCIDRTPCTPVNDYKIADLKEKMQHCFQKAVDLDLSIAITPHLDDGLSQGRWRNLLNFDPLKKHRGYTYSEAILYPLVDALKAVAKPNTQIYFGLQGEMSATIFRHPKSWESVASDIKTRFTTGSHSVAASKVKIGVSTNFNKLCGCVGQDIINPDEFIEKYPAAWEKVKHQFDLPAIASLYNSLDYFGLSSYPSLYPNFPTSMVENAVSQFDFEFGYFGLTVNDLINKGKEVHLSEFGLGGGIHQNGNTPARDAESAAKFPFFGSTGKYQRASDPWVLYDLSIPSPVRDYLRYFYGKTLEYLSNEKSYKYRVDAAFIWNHSSWDIQGIYPDSTTEEGSYRDPILVEWIDRHNKKAIEAAH